jgi:hypothetical protein
MSKVFHEIFALVTNFWGTNWQEKHVTFGLFEVVDTFGKILAKNLTKLLKNYNLNK